MKKKNLALLGLTVLVGLSLASCGGANTPSASNNSSTGTSNPGGTSTPSKTEPSTPTIVDAKGLDICLNYSGKQGITARDGFYNEVEKTNYAKNELLPSWKTLKSKLEIKDIRDASDYSTTKDDDTYSKLSTANYVSQTDSSQKIDLFYNTTSNIEKMGAAGQAVDLLQLANEGKMPNFKKWLNENPTMAKAITKGGKIYYTPYFDGYQDVERMFVMDTNVAKAVLDAVNFDKFDSTISGKGGAENTLKESQYTPYMDSQYNYKDAKTKVQCLKGSNVVDLEIKQTKNIILQQNELLANGCTGKQLAEQFRSYLDTAFAGNIGSGKLFENYSDIFVTESAAYNADELIALMRVVKANPGVVTGDQNAQVVGLFPRGVANNRVDNMADFMQIWGIQGMTSKCEMLYFGADGTLNDAATTQQTYDGLTYLSALYQEGLIMNEFWLKGSSTSGTLYLDRYFGKTGDNPGYGLLMYDYAASTGATNDIKDGIGTKVEKRKDGFKYEGAVTGVRAVLPPLAYWATEVNSDGDALFNAPSQHLTDLTGKTLNRYSEENRSLKNTSWCIPSTSDNIDVAAKLMDYLFSEEGVRIQDFGPDDGNYWTLGEIGGETAPIISDSVKSWIGTAGTDFWSFMRTYLGSTHGVGHVRETAIQIQSCNYYAQIGLNNLENAIAKGVVVSNRVDKHGKDYSWDCTVPTAGYTKPSDDVAASYQDLTAFWSSDKCAQGASGWVAVVKGNLKATDTSSIGTNKSSNSYSYSSALAQINNKNKSYLYSYAKSISSKCVPGYVAELVG